LLPAEVKWAALAISKKIVKSSAQLAMVGLVLWLGPGSAAF
jgi:hypothetical protein